MFNLGVAFSTALLAVIAGSIISLCRNEISQKWRQASSRFKPLSPSAGKELIVQRKLQKTRRAYIKERLRQREHLKREISGLDRLLNASSIDEQTYARYKKLLEMGYERRRQQTRERCGFTKTSTPT